MSTRRSRRSCWRCGAPRSGPERVARTFGGLAEIGLSRTDLEAFRRRIGPAAELVRVDFHGSTADPFALHRMRFRLADVPELRHALAS
jgi:hypothetical protein